MSLWDNLFQQVQESLSTPSSSEVTGATAPAGTADFVGPAYTPPQEYNVANNLGYGMGGWDPGADAILAAVKSGNAKLVDVYTESYPNNGYWDTRYLDKPNGGRGAWNGEGFDEQKPQKMLFMNGRLYVNGPDWGIGTVNDYKQVPTIRRSEDGSIMYGEDGLPTYDIVSVPIPTNKIQYGGRTSGGSNVFNHLSFSADANGNFTGYNPTVYQTGSDSGGFFGSSALGGMFNDLVSMVKENPVLPIVINAVVPGAGAVIQAANAIDQGNTAAAIAALSSIPGASDIASPEVVNAVKTATQTATLVNALSTGNTLAAINSVAALTGTKSTELGDSGVTVGDALKLANIASAIDSGNVNAVINGIQGLGTSSGTKEDAMVVSPSDAVDLLDNVMGLEAQPTQPTQAPDYTIPVQLEDGTTVNFNPSTGDFTPVAQEEPVPTEVQPGPPSNPADADAAARAQGWASEAEQNYARIVYGATTADEYRALTEQAQQAWEQPNRADIQNAAAQHDQWVQDLEASNSAWQAAEKQQVADFHAQQEQSAKDAGWKDYAEQYAAERWGSATPQEYRDAMAQNSGWSDYAEQQSGAAQGITNPHQYHDAIAQAEGWNSYDEKDWATSRGVNTPEAYKAEQDQEAYDRYLGSPEYAQQQEKDAVAAGWKDYTEQYDAETWGYATPQEYRDAMAQANGWADYAEQQEGESLGFVTPYQYHEATAQAEGWNSYDEKQAAAGMGMFTPQEYNAWLNPEEPAPVVEEPAPVIEEPVAVEEPTPTPVVEEPAPVVEEPAPVVEPTPVAEEPTPVAAETPVPAEVQPEPVQPTPVVEPVSEPVAVSDGTEQDVQALIDQITQTPTEVSTPVEEAPTETPSEAVQYVPEVPVETENQVVETAPTENVEPTPTPETVAPEEVLPIEEKTQDEMTPEDWAALYATPTTNPDTGETIVGADTSEYTPQDLGIDQGMLDEFQQNLVDQQESGQLPSQWQSNDDGTYTMVADDGSTLTIDETGQVVDSTEAPAGNLPGETPVQTTPTSGTTTGGGTSGGTPSVPVTPPVPSVPPVAKPAQPNFDLAALLTLLGAGMTQPQQEQMAQSMGSMREMDFESPLDVNFFGPTNKYAAGQNQQHTTKIATGGYIDDLLTILRG